MNTLRELEVSSEEYREGAWTHPATKEKYLRRVHAIFSIQHSNASKAPFLQYREKMQAQGVPDVHEDLFHGTQRACTLGEGEIGRRNNSTCSKSSCSLCRIILNSYDIKKCGSRHAWKRFGNGIYVSSCSSKAHDYVRNLDPTNQQLRALLINRVIVGRARVLTRDDKEATQSSNYDAVFGKPIDGGSLNYPEIVVKCNDAIRPKYVVLYSLINYTNSA